MYRLQEANPDELRAGEGNIFQRVFGKVKQSIYEVTAKYQKIGAQIDKISASDYLLIVRLFLYLISLRSCRFVHQFFDILLSLHKSIV